MIAAPLARKIERRIVVPVEIDVSGSSSCFGPAISRRLLTKPIANLEELLDKLPRAIDYLFLGM